MRARSLDAGRYEGARGAVGRQLVGVGEPLQGRPTSLSMALLATARQYGDKSARMLLRFAELSDSTLVWARTDRDEFRLGMIDGPWHYDDSRFARSTGIHNVRPAIWLEANFDFASTPQSVTYAFERGGRNFQRINDQAAETETREIWNRELALQPGP